MKTAMQTYVLRDVLGNKDIPETYTFECHADVGNPYVPKSNPTYQFQKELLRDMVAFLLDPQGDALFLSGPTGSGKTSAILEFAARFNWPVQNVTARGHMEFSDLVGHHTLMSEKPGEPAVMKFEYGPLAKAMALGHIFILNEADLIDPSELSGLNDILDGRPLVVEANGGKVIKPHPLFRFVATGNSRGSGDESGIYSGVVTQNLAAMDRYRMLLVDYPSRDVELDILANVAPEIPEELRGHMIDLANDIRTKFKGVDGDRQLNVTLSTRKLIQWAKVWLQYRGAPNPAQMAFDVVLLNRCNDEEFEAINRSAELIFNQTLWPARERK